MTCEICKDAVLPIVIIHGTHGIYRFCVVCAAKRYILTKKEAVDKLREHCDFTEDPEREIWRIPE